MRIQFDIKKKNCPALCGIYGLVTSYLTDFVITLP